MFRSIINKINVKPDHQANTSYPLTDDDSGPAGYPSVQRQAAAMFNTPKENNGNGDFRDPMAHEAGRQEWAARWRVVSSTKTRMWRAVAVYSAIFATSLISAVLIGVNGYGPQGSSSPHTCLLNMRISGTGPPMACIMPITELTLSMLVSILLALSLLPVFSNYLKDLHRHDRFRPFVCGVMAVIVITAGYGVWKGASSTCEIFREKGLDCGEGLERYGSGRGGLSFGLFLAASSAILWVVSTLVEYNAYRDKCAV
ncbi:hypothetical protein DFS34DRAFT_600617 [Phlyctochytrium arcticum]|nr:hypothetical protein DFS34DRAFT_600617 [Phlyctochytrium arcticum]